MRILILEDDFELRHALARYLRGLGHAVDECRDLRGARAAAEVNEHDVMVLDRMLPDGDSLQLLRDWRTNGRSVPTLFLTARDAIRDRIEGLQHGADDYLVKPFSMEELAARLHAIVRRGIAPESSLVRIGTLELDRGRREVRRNGVLIPLRPKEQALLELLISRRQRVVTKSQIMEACWDDASEAMSNVEESLIASLRRKLGKPDLIRTVRGGGYMFEEARDDGSR